MPDISIPQATQPAPLDGYWLPENADKILNWDYVNQRMSAAKNYWIATVDPDGQPHIVPVWGVWLENTLYFGGSPETRWARNLARDPRLTVHLDDSDQAVILEGRVTRHTDPDSPLINRVDDAYEVKFDMRHGPPIFELTLHKVLAWQTMETATRWLFD